MKKIAFLLLILFTVVQTLPTLQSMWGIEHAIVQDISEEKKTDKDDKKSTKEFIAFYNSNQNLTVKLLTQIHLAESIMPPPCFEKLTPPPDCC